jgi:hypothetical protein
VSAPPSTRAAFASSEAEGALARLDRRAFLRLAGLATAAGVLPSGCGAAPAVFAPPPTLRLSVLSPRAYATFQAFTLRLVGPACGALIVERTIDPAAAADAWVARLPGLAGALGQGLAVLEWAVWPLLPKFAPFTALGSDAQDRVLDDLLRSRMALKRDLYRGLKSLATLTVYAQPAARGRLGHPGPFSAEGIRAAMTWTGAS